MNLSELVPPDTVAAVFGQRKIHTPEDRSLVLKSDYDIVDFLESLDPLDLTFYDIDNVLFDDAIQSASDNRFWVIFPGVYRLISDDSISLTSFLFHYVTEQRIVATTELELEILGEILNGLKLCELDKFARKKLKRLEDYLGERGQETSPDSQ